jgi:pimeloyl-ACP methyl ester carboxylesterase
MKRREVLSVLAVISNGSPAILSRTTSKKKTIFVLVHGAWHGGWCWKKVSGLLGALGHQVYTPTLTGLGERSHLLAKEIDLEMHIQDIVSMLEYEDLTDVILVGHSYGGMVITGVADKERKRLSHVVYVDAFLPEMEKSLQDYVSISFEQIAKSKGNGWQVPLLGGSVASLGIKEKDDIDWMTPRIGPHPLKTFTQRLHLSTPLDKSLKKTYIQLTDDRPHFNDSLNRARHQGFQIYSLLSGGHDAMVTQPAALAKIFNALA